MAVCPPCWSALFLLFFLFIFLLLLLLLLTTFLSRRLLPPIHPSIVSFLSPSLTQKLSTRCVTLCPLVTLIQIRVKTLVYFQEGEAREKQRCAKCQGWWGGSGPAVQARLWLSLHGIITNSDSCESTAQFMRGPSLRVPPFPQEIKFTCYLWTHHSPFPSHTSVRSKVSSQTEQFKPKNNGFWQSVFLAKPHPQNLLLSARCWCLLASIVYKMYRC